MVIECELVVHHKFCFICVKYQSEINEGILHCMKGKLQFLNN